VIHIGDAGYLAALTHPEGETPFQTQQFSKAQTVPGNLGSVLNIFI